MKNRLRLVIEALKEERKVFNDSDFADMIGKSKSFLSDMLSGNKKISRRTAESVCEAFPEINFKWLLTGEGDMFVASDNEMAPELAGVLGRIPLIPITAFAGYGEMSYNDIPVDEYYTVKEFRQADFLLRIKGDSMAPLFNSGDIIACKKVEEVNFWQWHCIYAIATKNQGVLIKRVEKGDKEGEICLMSENMNYDPFDLPQKEIDAVALVLGAIILI